jgi:hypothetical protein
LSKIAFILEKIIGLVRKGPFNHESIDKMPNDDAKAFEEIRARIIPSMVDYSFYEWKNFNRNDRGQKDYISLLLAFNYNNRVVFYIDKPKR